MSDDSILTMWRYTCACGYTWESFFIESSCHKCVGFIISKQLVPSNTENPFVEKFDFDDD